MINKTTPRTLIFLWDNFGPYHMDRLEAVHRHLSDRFVVIGIELTPTSTIYAWGAQTSETFEKRTVFMHGEPRSVVARVRQILAHLSPARETYFFLCHYQDPAIFLLALLLRLRGGRVFTMNCSKFDDFERYSWREAVKTIFMLPYHGALSSGIRSKDYMRFLRLPPNMICGEYNTVSLARVRRQAGVPPAPAGPAFSVRYFTAVARLVPKKNLSMLLSAYRMYRDQIIVPRPLHVCGSGPLESELRRQAKELEIAEHIVFRGWVPDQIVSETLGQTLALLLPSVEEQFGNVVIEAQAMGLPVILSDNCGARDHLVRSGVNGFVIEPDNPRGLAFFMLLLSQDAGLWRRMCREAAVASSKGDVGHFVSGVRELIGNLPR